MSKKKHLLRIIVLLSTLPVLWLGIHIPRFLFETRGDALVQLVPKDVNYILCFKGEHLIKESFNGIILKEDQFLIDLLQGRFKKDDERLNYRLGIDFKGTFIQYETNFRGTLLKVNLLPLLNSSQFEKHIGQFVDERSLISSIGHAGIIVSSTGNHVTSKKILKAYIKEIKKAEQASFWKNKIIFKKDQEVMILKQNIATNNSKLIMHELVAEMNNRELVFHGHYSVLHAKHKPISLKIKEKGFHLSVKDLPENVSDSLSNLLNTMGLPSGKPTAISMNYYGMELVETPTLYLIPQADLLLYFSENYSIKESLDSLQQAGIIEINNSKINYGKQSYFWKQINERAVYIGANPFNPETWSPSNQVFINGNPDVITKVAGTGMMRRFLDLIPLYAAGNKLSNKIETIQLTSNAEKSNTHHFEARIILKKGQHPVNSALSFLIESGLSSK